MPTPNSASAPRSPDLCHAVTRAVREILPRVRSLDIDAISTEIRNLVCAYWGPHHGMSDAEIQATARDVKRSAERGKDRR